MLIWMQLFDDLEKLMLYGKGQKTGHKYVKI
jgi:hypothetical protein